MINAPVPLFGYEDPDRLQHMYDFVRGYAEENGMVQTLEALVFADRCHKGQFRRSRNCLPYISHPLLMACHAVTLGVGEDDLLSTVLLHDTLEDCGVKASELPAGDEVKRVVELLTFRIREGEDKAAAKKRYFETLSLDPVAALTKLLDRCNNVSYMVDAFSAEKVRSYVEETKTYVYPLPGIIRTVKPDWAAPAYTVKYHIYSVISTIEIMMERKLW